MIAIIKLFEHQLFFTFIVIFGWLITKFLTSRAIKRISINFGVTIERRKIIVKIFNIIYSIIALIFITTVWGVDKKELFLFFTSIITVLGIGFFAQWSFLSNITAGIILFFNHPLRLGDYIKIVEKDFFIEGKITNVTFFFIHLENKDKEKITIPNAIALQKTIVILESRN
jgi:small-conductance mechanosensitive channel